MAAPATRLTNVDITGNLNVGGTAITDGVANDDIAFAAGKQMKPDAGTASATTGAATLSKQAGVITSESLTTAAGADYTLTLTNTLVAATSIVLATVHNGTNSQGVPVLRTVTPGAGSVVIIVRNTHASQALNGTLKIAFLVLNPAA